MSRHVLILNRWNNRFAEYHRYIDHTADRVAVITTPKNQDRLDARLTEEIALVADLTDHEAVLDAARDLTRRHGAFTHVLALSEFDLELGAKLRADLGIGGKGPDDVRRVRDKVVMKADVAAAGVRVPVNREVVDAGTVRAFVAEVGLPVVLKPCRGADSQGVYVLRTPDDVDRTLATVTLDGYECEEFVDGNLYQVDGVVSGGVLRSVRSWRCIGSCLDFALDSPFGSVMNDDPVFESRIVAFTARVLHALDLTDEVFHLEVFREHGTDDLVFLEIGARAGGGQLRFVWEELFGLDLIEAAIHVQLGIPHEFPPIAASDEVGGYLMMPEPPVRPCRIIGVRSLVGVVPDLYAETLPEPGAVLDGNGGAVHTAGAFRFRAASMERVERGIAAARTAYDIAWEPVDERDAPGAGTA